MGRDLRNEHPNLQSGCRAEVWNIVGRFYWWDSVFSSDFVMNGKYTRLNQYDRFEYGVIIKEEYLPEVLKAYGQIKNLDDYWAYNGENPEKLHEAYPKHVTVLGPPLKTGRRRGKRHRMRVKA